jgi:hypothetical protein
VTYFLMVLAFIGWLVLAAAATLATRYVPALSAAYPYAWRIALWASAGIVAANAALAAILFLSHAALPPGGALQLTWGMAAVLGPLLVSPAGWLAGAVIGAVQAMRRTARAD